ncbi:AI-2E family transporter [Phenylobacterium montanum]|uniref:AI-2E family transporter n=1 Tax=Phenylobacterium montanum TaxID=2823693 RepID=A0A975IV24_9CAUL|nr:AI-2E family transporter [Caulobacter sp. S6]QUD86866.1 AI-2E family transporter [Caulobacter sp. S6]
MPREASTPADTARIALVVIAVVVAGAAFYWLNGILTPLALALFLTVMIDAMARALRERVPFLPDQAALPIAVAVSLAALASTVFLVINNASLFAGQIALYGPKLNAVINGLAQAMGLKAPPTLNELINRLNPDAYLGKIAETLQGFATNALGVVIYLGFVLASRHGFQRKTRGLFPTEASRQHAAEVFQRIRTSIENYLWIQTVACGLIAVASWGVMAGLGLDNATFWAFVIFIVGFIPIIGGAVGILAPPLFALVQFDHWWRALAMLAGLQVINFIVGNIIYPRMQGRSLNIDPVVILLSLAFWGAIWGVAGMFLSTPLTVMAMVILAQFPGTRWIAVLLSSDGDPLGAEKTPAPLKITQAS